MHHGGTATFYFRFFACTLHFLASYHWLPIIWSVQATSKNSCTAIYTHLQWRFVCNEGTRFFPVTGPKFSCYDRENFHPDGLFVRPPMPVGTACITHTITLHFSFWQRVHIIKRNELHVLALARTWLHSHRVRASIVQVISNLTYTYLSYDFQSITSY